MKYYEQKYTKYLLGVNLISPHVNIFFKFNFKPITVVKVCSKQVTYRKTRFL